LWGPNSIVPVASTSTDITRPSSTRSLSAGRYESTRSSSVSSKPSKHHNDGSNANSSSATSKACPHIVAFHDAYTDPEKGCVCMVSYDSSIANCLTSSKTLVYSAC
jgi:hypothetical protein